MANFYQQVQHNNKYSAQLLFFVWQSALINLYNMVINIQLNFYSLWPSDRPFLFIHTDKIQVFWALLDNCFDGVG